MFTLVAGVFIVLRILDGGELVVKFSDEEVIDFIKQIGGESKFNVIETFTCLKEARQFMSCFHSLNDEHSISQSGDFVFYRKKRKQAVVDDIGDSLMGKKQRCCEEETPIIHVAFMDEPLVDNKHIIVLRFYNQDGVGFSDWRLKPNFLRLILCEVGQCQNDDAPFYHPAFLTADVFPMSDTQSAVYMVVDPFFENQTIEQTALAIGQRVNKLLTSTILKNGITNTFESDNLSVLCQMMSAEHFPLSYMMKDARVVVEREKDVLESMILPNKLDYALTPTSL